MDPLSITASVAGIATLAYQIIGYLGQVKSGGKERLRLCTGITHLWLSISALQEQLSADAIPDFKIPPQLLPLFEPDGIFKDIEQEIKDLDEKLKTRTSHGKIRQTIVWPFTQQDVIQTIERVHRLQETLHLALTQSSHALTQEIYRDGQAVKSMLDENRLKDIIDWISPLNFVGKQNMLFNEHHEGTCKWFLQSDDFQAWREGESTVLFCPGIPGAGKTFLSSIVVHELDRLRLCQEGGVKEAAIVMLYCKWDDPLSQSIEAMVASLMKQIIQRYGVVLDEVIQMFNKHSQEETRPSREQMLSILSMLLRRFPKIFVVVDGLDELREEKDRLALLRILTSIQTTKVNIMVTSRPLPNITRHFRRPRFNIVCDICDQKEILSQYHCSECDETKFGGFDVCQPCYDDGNRCGYKGHLFIFQYNAFIVDIAAVEEDLTTYVQWRVRSSEDLQQFVEIKAGLMDQIVETVVKANDGMFLLAKFNMDTLASKLNIKQVVAALHTLPKELDGTYTDAMSRIEDLPASTRETVMEFLRWVVFAERPLHEREIEHALAVCEGDEDIDDDNIIRARALADKCAGLVQLDESDCVRLVHYSAESFFSQNSHHWFPGGSPQLISACLTYLLFTPFRTGACSGSSEAAEFEDRLQRYPFLAYASVNWGKHLQVSGSEVHYALAKTLLTDAGCLATVTQALWYLESQNAASWSAKDGSGIHLATHFGLKRLVEALIIDGHDPDRRDINGITPLSLVSVRDGVDIATVLIEAGASINTIDNSGRSPLHKAIFYYRDDIAKLLLQQGDIDVNISHSRWSHLTPLAISAINSRLEILQLLLNNPRLDVNRECSSPLGATALMSAALYGETESVKMLLTHPDVEIDHQDQGGSTALVYAAQGGFYNIVEALLDQGADTEVAQHGTLGTALLRAIDTGATSTVQLLLQRGANVHHKDCFDRGMLHGAAVNGRFQIIQILLAFDETLDVNMQDAHGKTTLHDAAYRGDIRTVETLLKHGANPTIKDSHGRTPTRVAREKNNIAIMDVLRAARLQQNAAPGITPNPTPPPPPPPPQRTDTGTILRSASRTDTSQSLGEPLPLWTLGSANAMEELKERLSDTKIPEDINSVDPELGQAALHYAAHHDNVKMIELLIFHGADINLRSRYGRTPLHLAAMGNNKDAARALLDAEARVDIEDTWNAQPLAISDWSMDSVGILLLERGAPIFSERMNMTAWLEAAAREGNKIAVQRLVKAGAETWRKNSSGKTPYMIAKSYGHEDIANFILQLSQSSVAPSSESTSESTSGEGSVSTGGNSNDTDITSEAASPEAGNLEEPDIPRDDEKANPQSADVLVEENSSPETTRSSNPAGETPIALKSTDENKTTRLYSERGLNLILMTLVLVLSIMVVRNDRL
ncbi:hypothetical protein AOCH_000121 [Aspergillus ochraceoroseus]|uniref:Uncharacterized protein n=1 Tax=Aspergillus ochraceoroseus TaxID=138278 RepID=A0A0F8XCW4_9EURO|nr:hypothetical protein AOCH_000121 [Aspergillus ochraceoroseus]